MAAPIARARRGQEPADFNGRIAQPLARYLVEVHGPAALDEVAEAVGLTAGDILGGKRWLSAETFGAFLQSARDRLSDDEQFRQACAHRLSESYGPLAYLGRAASIRTIYHFLAKTMGVVSRVSHFEVLESRRTSAVLRYTSERPETRLMCLSRQAQLATTPTVWGLPQASVEERSCIARGDECCEYRLAWYELPRWLPILLGALGGGVAAYFVFLAQPLESWVLTALPLLGAACGLILEQRRAFQANIEIGEEWTQGLRELARETTEARQEVLELSDRQAEWASALEDQVAERTAILQGVVEQVQRMREKRVVHLRGVSHDLRSPMAVIAGSHELLEDHAKALDREGRETLQDMGLAIERMNRLLDQLMESATAEAGLIDVTPEVVPMAPLAERLRRRLRALTLGRDIRVSAFATREVPESIRTDLLLFERVLDNLLTNAAKYTHEGSIVVEITGSPGFLCVKVSDTGSGISPERIRRVFRLPGSDPQAEGASSYGVGLSIVVRVLDQLGGRLEVMSRPDMGTTFWAYFPTELPTAAEKRSRSEDNMDAIIGRVVTIRRIPSS